MLRIAYCQLSAHPAYCGSNGNYCKEPIYSSDGLVLSDAICVDKIYKICRQIHELYINRFKYKIQQLLYTIKNKNIDILVFPEYTIPAECLKLIYDFCQAENCVCIAASHTVQQSNEDIYKDINMDISIDESINKSCCPIIFPGENTSCFFKRNKSKWEANMEVEPPIPSENAFTFNFKEQKVTVLLCIDALHIDVDKKTTDILIVPAASPSDGSFKNKFESHLTKEIPTIFCNFCSYGKSTVYCSVPKLTNLAYAEQTHITKTAPYEEVVVIVDLDMSAQVTKVHSINTTNPINIAEVLPIFYREDGAEQKMWDMLRIASEKKNYGDIDKISKSFLIEESGILSKKKSYLCSGIRERTLSYSQIVNSSQFIYINDFQLKQYEINWLDKTLKSLMDAVTSGEVHMSDIGTVIIQLGKEYDKLLPHIKEKIDLPVFEERIKSYSVFQNRGGEIQQFRDAQQNMCATIFIVQGFSQIGKSAFIDRLKFLYSFSTADCQIPKGGGFESLIRWICQVCKKPMDWESLDEENIEIYSNYFAQYLYNLNKTIIILRSTGKLFDNYNQPKTTLFLCSLAKKLAEMRSGIKLIIENARILPGALTTHPNIVICKLRPLFDMYIERLIEQTANNITYSFSLPQVTKNIVKQCHGNPAIARMVGVCIGNRLNSGQDSNVSQDEIDSFADKYTDGILDALKVTPDERELITESTIYRLCVPEEAFRKLPHYNDEIFNSLRNKLLIDETDNWLFVNPLISNSLRKSIKNASLLHKIAAEYFNNEYIKTGAYVSKAEYLYHLSFCSPKLQLQKDLAYYANDILDAAIQLINSGEFDIARSHLDSIRFFSNSYNLSEFSFYYAFCHIMSDEYKTYRQLFDASIENAKGPKDVLYYRMIDRLIGVRYLAEAENLLNEVQEFYPHTRQMDALWVSYYYATKQTRERALQDAVKLTQESAGDFYSAKILVRIYLRENMTNEALKEIEAVLDTNPNNGWALKMQYRIETGKYMRDKDDFDDEGEDQEI